MTEVWLRNPLAYIKECAELLVPNICWDRGVLVSRSIEPQRHLEMHYSKSVDYRILLVGDQGSAEIRPNSSFQMPTAVYPTWEYGVGTINELELLLDEPVGASTMACKDPKVPVQDRPVWGQEHRVVVTSWPDGQTNIGRAFLRQLSELQDAYPEAIIHLHGSYSFRIAFGMGYRSADMEPREVASKGKIMLANGKTILHEDSPKFQQWIHLVNASTTDLTIPRNRCMFNIKSALWAGENFSSASKFNTKPGAVVDPHATLHTPTTSVSHLASPQPVQPGDKSICNACSLQSTCKYFRDGGVCAIPNTDAARLSAKFGTRDSDRIIEGVGTLVGLMVDRALKGIENEEFDGELNPETTKALHLATSDGMKLAKLVNPALAAAGATKIGVFINNGERPTVNGLVAGAIAELEAEGVNRADITEHMITTHIVRKESQAIEASSRE